MSKALVIKNANFSANKVTTITFEEEVPCTGVSFDSDTVNISSLGVADIRYSVTPSNTTDMMEWSSSNESVATVNNNTVTVNGIGTCVITLKCGQYTDTCTLNVSILESPVYIDGKTDTQTDPLDQNISGVLATGSSRSRVVCVGAYSDGFFAEELTHVSPWIDVGAVTAIKIPANTENIHVHATQVYGNGTLFFVDADSSFVKGDKTYLPITSQALLPYTSSSGVKTIDTDVAIPDGATGYIVDIRPAVSTQLEAITTVTALKEYAEDTIGISISYQAS